MIIRNLCPNCDGPIHEDRLRRGLPCHNCIPNEYIRYVSTRSNLRKTMQSLNKVKGMLSLFLLEDELKEFEYFFKKILGKELWSIQRSWAKRMLSGESFALIAPTGVGKTTLLQVYALFKASRNHKVLYIVPTTELLNQLATSLNNLKKDLDIAIMASQEFKKSILSNSYDALNKGLIVITTHAFIHKNKELFNDKRFDLVIVDDFDALMKSSSILNLILKLLGISDNAIKLAFKIINLKQELAFYKVLGKDDKLKEVQERLYEAELELTKSMNYDNIGQLLIATATGRARSSRAKILRELLRFEIGSILDYMRNLVEVVEPIDSIDLTNLISKLIGGTLIFVSKDLGMRKAEEVEQELLKKGIKAEIAKNRRSIDKLRREEINVLIGISTYYGILTRGIDEPKRIYNVIFIGIPKFMIPLDNALNNPLRLVRVLQQLQQYSYTLNDEEKNLIRALSKLSPSKIKAITVSIKKGIELNPPLGDLVRLVLKVENRVKRFISDYVSRKSKLVLEDSIIIKRDNKCYLLIPDVMTYLQASGRCSRLLNRHMTLGLVILLYDDHDLLNIFTRRLKYYVLKYSPLRLKDINLKEIQDLQVKSRNEEFSGTEASTIKSVLIVVESPTKARTIAKMFGTPGKRYLGDYIAYETVITLNNSVLIATIAPTLGHIYDLVVDEGIYGIRLVNDTLVPIYTTIKKCRECGHQFTDELSKCPKCGSIRIRDSRLIVNALRKLAQEADEVILATDPDEEGEKIAYDVFLTLRPYIDKFYRIEFHEITKNEFIRALQNPRRINLGSVNAQIVRRVDDRLIGFEISNVLKKEFSMYWLGGGRVQTPVLKWVIDRYVDYLRDRGYLVLVQIGDLKIKYFTKSIEDAKKLAEMINKHGIRVVRVSEEIREIHPKPPYTTDTLLSDASRILKIPPAKVMKIAQDLFELGLITYHRTDSTHVSSVGVEVAKEFLISKGLIDYFTPRSWGEKGTHECIRPTKPEENVETFMHSLIQTNVTPYHKQLYSLIFKRFIASQMRPSLIKYIIADVYVDKLKIARVEVPIKIIKQGFTVVDQLSLMEFVRDKSEIILKPDPEDVKVIRASKSPLYTVSDLVRLMREQDIGRPSTYAKAIENNLRHGYIVLSKRRLKAIPTKLGIQVIRFLESNYPELVSTSLTRELETILDYVKVGKLSRDEALLLVYSDLVGIKLTQVLMVGRSQAALIESSNEYVNA